MEEVYDTSRLLAQAEEWRLRAQQEAQTTAREHCLAQAARYEEIVRRSFEVPALMDAG